MITVRVHSKRLYFILKWTGNISLVGFKLATKEYSADIIIFYKLYYIRYVVARRGGWDEGGVYIGIYSYRAAMAKRER